jgi:hypothetical protein
MTLQEIEHLWKWASNNPDHDTNWHDPVVVAFANLVSALERPWVGLTDEDLEFWTEELGRGELGRGVLRAVAEHLREKNT